LLLALPVFAAAQEEPLVRVEVDPPEVTVGEAATLRVTVLVPTWFPKPPVFPSFELANAITRLPPDSSYPTSERLGRDTWSGIVRNYRIYPLSAGTYRLTGSVMTVTYANPGAEPAVAEVEVPKIVVRSVVPAGAEALDPYIAGTALSLTREVDGDPENLEAGDALVVRHIAELDGLPAIFLPPLGQVPDLPGVSVYADEPVVEDGNVATRTEGFTLVFEAGGEFSLPEVALEWWNLEQQAAERATLPALTFTVAGPPLTTSTHDVLNSDGRSEAAIVAAAVLLLLLAAYLLRRAWRSRRRRAAQFRETEEYAFRQVGRVASMNDERAFYAELVRWLEHSQPVLGPRQFARQFGDKVLLNRMEHLAGSLYAADASHRSDCKEIYGLLAQARAQRLSSTRRLPGRTLPPMNPGTTGR
jgi:hypothetical protein